MPSFISLCLILISSLAFAAAQSATYYTPAGNLGSCGTALQNSDDIVAMSSSLWESKSVKCGQKVQVKYKTKTITVTIQDTCTGCNSTHIDMAVGAFKKVVGSQWKQLGVVPIEWDIVGEDSDPKAGTNSTSKASKSKDSKKGKRHAGVYEVIPKGYRRYRG